MKKSVTEEPTASGVSINSQSTFVFWVKVHRAVITRKTFIRQHLYNRFTGNLLIFYTKQFSPCFAKLLLHSKSINYLQCKQTTN